MAVTAAWLAAAASGLLALERYAAAPGAPGSPPEHWPAASSIARAAASGTLLVFAHPDCPCTQATLENLDRLLPRVSARFDVVMIVGGAAADEAIDATPVGRRARQLPGVRLLDDRLGEETRRFAVATSGHALVYDADGRLRFSGGLTPARGHAGSSPALEAIHDLARGREPGLDRGPVFGCALRAEDLA